MPAASRKQNIRIAVKRSEVNFGLDLKEGEIGTDGENLFIGSNGKIVSITPPIGSVIFWQKAGFSTTENGSPTFLSDIILPRGWVIANGELVTDPLSKFYGYYVANLSNDIFLQGGNALNLGSTGGTNDSNHKHNIAHHHYTFNGVNNNAGYIGNSVQHRHLYNDYRPGTFGAGEGGGDFGTNARVTQFGRTSDPGGAHDHTVNGSSVNIGNATTVLVNSNNNLNGGNPRNLADDADFTENRPNYMSGYYIIRVR